MKTGVQERAQPVAAAGMTQFAEGLGFDLANALASDGEVLADLFECVLASILQPEPHLDYFFLARAESFQNFRGLFA